MQQLPTFPTVSPDDGVERTVLSEAPELMVVSFRFKTGAEGKPQPSACTIDLCRQRQLPLLP